MRLALKIKFLKYRGFHRVRSTCALRPTTRQGSGMLFCGFRSRHKLSGSGLKKLKLLLTLETAVGLVGPAGELGHVPAFLRWSSRSSHLLTRQGDIQTHYLSLKMCHSLQVTPAAMGSLVLQEGLLGAVAAQFLAVCSSEWALKGFPPLWCLRVFKEPLRAGERQM